MDVKEIETAISQLPPAEVAELPDWFAQFHSELWDKRIEEDLKAGRLQSVLDEGEAGSRRGEVGSRRGEVGSRRGEAVFGTLKAFANFSPGFLPWDH